MTLEVDSYRVRLRFAKLFADPRIFDSPPTFVRGYLVSRGLSEDSVERVYETTEDVTPIDDNGRPSTTAGSGKFQYSGKLLRSEYMQRASLQLEYCDFGSGLAPEEHRKSWMIGRWDDLFFELKEWHHQHLDTGVAKIDELYALLKTRARPTTMATVELPMKAGGPFNATVKHLADQLARMGQPEGGTIEVYAARELDNQEKKALETRLGREATGSTVYIIFTSKMPAG